MKILLITLMSFYCYPKDIPHDAVIAVFKVYKDEGLKLDITFDIEDYTRTHNIAHQEVTSAHLSSYLGSTNAWTIDGAIMDINVLSIDSDRDHFRASCSFKNAPAQIDEITIHNEFLLKVKDHSNIIMLDINETSKDFRMHQERKELVISY